MALQNILYILFVLIDKLYNDIYNMICNRLRWPRIVTNSLHSFGSQEAHGPIGHLSVGFGIVCLCAI